MPHRDAQLEELNRLVGRLVDERARDHEAYLREREILSAMVVDLERLATSILAVIERTKTRLAGIAPSGAPVEPPAA